jgi:hypothetical protein
MSLVHAIHNWNVHPMKTCTGSECDGGISRLVLATSAFAGPCLLIQAGEYMCINIIKYLL